MSDFDVDALAAELGEFAPTEKNVGRSAKEERIVAGFEEIQRFTEQNGQLPQHGEDRDIFERLYAVRLDRLRALSQYHSLLAPLDQTGLLRASGSNAMPPEDDLDIDELAAELSDVPATNDITKLRHVRSSAEKRAAEEIANRTPCEDFDTFRPLFDRVQREVKLGMRQSRPIVAGRRSIEAGDFFVLDGITLYIAEIGEPLKVTAGEVDRRMRVIFSNGTESDLLLRSLQRAFYDDPVARRLVSTEEVQLSFNDELEEGDVESGTIYVLRSLSDHPYIAEYRDTIHKVGVTGGKVEVRIANAEHEATFLLAKVQVVATYKLAGINRSKMESLFHRLFATSRLDITIDGRFGHAVQPKEWFVVPLPVIDDAVTRIRDGSIVDYRYDPVSAELVRR